MAPQVMLVINYRYIEYKLPSTYITFLQGVIFLISYFDLFSSFSSIHLFTQRPSNKKYTTQLSAPKKEKKDGKIMSEAVRKLLLEKEREKKERGDFYCYLNIHVQM